MKIKHFALLLITSMLIVSILPVSVDAGSGLSVITYGAIKGETLFVGETRDCNEMIKYPEEYVPEWTNSDPSVLSLDNGIIQALKPGKADIDVTLDGESMLHYSATVISDSISLGYNQSQSIYLGNRRDIESMYSSNTAVATVAKDWSGAIVVTGKAPGSTTVYLESSVSGTIPVKVTVAMTPGDIQAATRIDQVTFPLRLGGKPSPYSDVIDYGTNALSGATLPGAVITVTMNGANYTTTAGSTGAFSIGIPIARLDTPVTLTSTLAGVSWAKVFYVSNENSTIYSTNRLYKKTKKLKVYARDVHAGDIVKVKIGKKVYKKKIKANAAEVNLKFKIKKPGKHGKKVTIKLINKYNQTLSQEKEYVYLTNKVHIGDSKKKVKWIVGWNHPHHKNIYSWGEQWCYDDDGDGFSDSYLYFNRKGRVKSWSVHK